jgi:hypothetical protein
MGRGDVRSLAHQKLDLITEMLQQVADQAVYYDEHGRRVCRYCRAKEEGYYDSRFIQHRERCLTRLADELRNLEEEE